MWTLIRFCSGPDCGADDNCENVGRREWPADEKVVADNIGFGASDHDLIGGVGCADESRWCRRWGDEYSRPTYAPSGSGIGVRVLDAVHGQSQTMRSPRGKTRTADKVSHATRM